jgi:hypothetical protein
MNLSTLVVPQEPVALVPVMQPLVSVLMSTLVLAQKLIVISGPVTLALVSKLQNGPIPTVLLDNV